MEHGGGFVELSGFTLGRFKRKFEPFTIRYG
jgi:hypothetical protein